MSIILGMQKKVERMKKAIKLTHEVYNLLETMGVKKYLLSRLLLQGVKKYETFNDIIKKERKKERKKEQFNTIYHVRLGRSQLPPVPADL